jgi:(2R)-sulfolactate sulfo-lyase subunit alpha
MCVNKQGTTIGAGDSMPHKFLVHARQDSVGGAMAEIVAGETIEGIILKGESTLTIRAIENIPLGHKIALTLIAQGESVMELPRIPKPRKPWPNISMSTSAVCSGVK